MNLKGKVVLVTGAATGIGRAIALAFAEEGASVAINYRSRTSEAENVLSEIEKFGGDNILVQADVSKESDVSKIFEEITKHYGSIDILVNNAGDARNIDLINSPLADWKYQMDNNFFSAVMCSREFLKLKGSEDLRKIINISSIWGFDDKCLPDYMAYGASKAALNSFTKNMAKKFAPNTLINAIAPGYVLTPHWGEMSDEEKQLEGNSQLIQRFIDPSEIAQAAILIAKNDAITGTIMSIDGGIGLKTI